MLVKMSQNSSGVSSLSDCFIEGECFSAKMVVKLSASAGVKQFGKALTTRNAIKMFHILDVPSLSGQRALKVAFIVVSTVWMRKFASGHERLCISPDCLRRGILIVLKSVTSGQNAAWLGPSSADLLTRHDAKIRTIQKV